MPLPRRMMSGRVAFALLAGADFGEQVMDAEQAAAQFGQGGAGFGEGKVFVEEGHQRAAPPASCHCAAASGCGDERFRGRGAAGNLPRLVPIGDGAGRDKLADGVAERGGFAGAGDDGAARRHRR